MIAHYRVDDWPLDENGRPLAYIGPVCVFLDDRLCHFVQAADALEGWVEAPLINEDGQPVFDHYDDDYAIVRRTGRVDIVQRTSMWKPPTPEEIRNNPFLVSNQSVGFV